MRKPTKHIALLTVASLGLAACSDSVARFHSEAGAAIDEGAFGNPTMTNTLLNTGQLSVAENLGRRFNSEVAPMVNFAFNSTTLDEEARITLRQQADWIRQFPEVRFRVFGHTDRVGSNSFNQRLGLRRARAVVSFLASQGISRSRLEAVSSFGETRPLVDTADRERRNRRTVTEVTGFVQSHPLILNGKYAALSHREYINTAQRGDNNKQGQINLNDSQ